MKLTQRKVFIHSVRIIDNSKNNITKMHINCGKGFYVRSFARDIAESLGSKGHIYSLKRTKVGKFQVNNANLLDDLLKIRQTLFEFKGFHSSVSLLDDILAYEIVDQNNFTSISQGKSIKIDLRKFDNSLLNSTDRKIVFLTDKGKIVSFGKLQGDLFKPDKVLI